MGKEKLTIEQFRRYCIEHPTMKFSLWTENQERFWRERFLTTHLSLDSIDIFPVPRIICARAEGQLVQFSLVKSVLVDDETYSPLTSVKILCGWKSGGRQKDESYVLVGCE